MIIDEKLISILKSTEDITSQLILTLNEIDNSLIYLDVQKIGITENDVLFYIPKGKSSRVIETTSSKLLSKIFLPIWSDKGFLKGVDSINSLRALYYPNTLKEKVIKNNSIDSKIKTRIEELEYNIPQKTKQFFESFINNIGINANSLGRVSEIFSEKFLVSLKFSKNRDKKSWSDFLLYEKSFDAKGSTPRCTFKVVQGSKLLEYYNTKSFWKSINSCMSNDTAKSYLNIYRDNKNIALGVLLTNETNPKVMSRCLLWNTDQGDILMDRRYMTDYNPLNNYLDEVCADNNLYYRNSNSSSRQMYHSGKLIEKNFSITIEDTGSRYPYMDTFCYFTFFEKKTKGSILTKSTKKMITVKMSPAQVSAEEVSKTFYARNTSGSTSTFHFNIGELLPWELIELIIKKDPRISNTNPFTNGNYTLTLEQRHRICKARPDLIHDAIWSWSYGNNNKWLEFLSTYPEYRKHADFTKLNSNQIRNVYMYCVENREFTWIKLCRVKNLITKEFVQVLENALQKMGPSEFIDMSGIKATNPIVRMGNKSKKNIVLFYGNHYPIKEDRVTLDHITIMEYFIKPLRKDNLDDLLKQQPFWTSIIPDDHIPLPSKKTEKNSDQNDEEEEIDIDKKPKKKNDRNADLKSKLITELKKTKDFSDRYDFENNEEIF